MKKWWGLVVISGKEWNENVGKWDYPPYDIQLTF